MTAGGSAPLVLGVETSCDETACAVTLGREVLSNVVASQVDLHQDFGGVVPEIAGRAHQRMLPAVLQRALKGAGIDRPDMVAVTAGPGLIGALLVGVSYCQGLAGAWGVPLVPVNHLYGHLWGVAAVHGVEPPFNGLVVSGGHTSFYLWEEHSDRPELLGGTVDDAAGEAFDKVAALLSLGYPGGPAIEEAAGNGRPSVDFPLAGAGMEGVNLSFSGLKTAVLYHLRGLGREPDEEEKADIACSFQDKVARTLALKTAYMIEATGVPRVVVGGGVAANRRIREQVVSECERLGVEVWFPPSGLSQDNAAMIGLCAGRLLETSSSACTLNLIPEPYARSRERSHASW